ncbi:hypothetical protein ASPZODRAFT_19698 [Penicilliopsis zonata CBS 506.65]|uniref:Uncharacterized protein n=1 Tax=Penicilliopsis zonata CBS 506.65 TaxID=1073090 RepID=A0A1L9S803_9EURO|nr:hypothetical protein ASPZODRAFT_19698 [Penicilliopsis zonata CBS 506.65]OJJ43295.1 hypothetical protein ASPZODRAFT_19698 [Penicilliopsis zonata CBS 506.65]
MSVRRGRRARGPAEGVPFLFGFSVPTEPPSRVLRPAEGVDRGSTKGTESAETSCDCPALPGRHAAPQTIDRRRYALPWLGLARSPRHYSLSPIEIQIIYSLRIGFCLAWCLLLANGFPLACGGHSLARVVRPPPLCVRDREQHPVAPPTLPTALL